MTNVNKRSPVWEYFDINSDNNKFAVCLLCGIQISRGGEGKKAGTSSLKNHLKMKHPDKFHAINKDKTVGMSSSIPSVPIPSASSFSATFDKKLFCDVNNIKAKKYSDLLAEMIALDFEQYSIVERPGFSRLLKQVLPRYKMPSCETLSQTIIPDIYVRIFEKLKQKILGSLAISVTSDVWTCFEDNSSFLRLTAHWITSSFKLEHGVLAIKPIRGPRTGETIATELNTIADRWGINLSKIHLLIHYSDANIVKDFRVAEYISTRCFIHLLQEVVTESINIQLEVSEMLTSSRRLVMHFVISSLAREKMLEIQTELNLPQHQLMQDITTRWNSSYYMVERLLEQKRALSLYFANHDTLANLTSQQWCLMEQFVKLLKPFEEITKITSSDFSCISEVIPHVAALKKYLDKDETEKRTPNLPHMRASLKTELESRFAFVSQDSNYLIATFLDPRFKTNYLGVIEADRARLKILSEYIKMTSKEMSTSNISSGPTPAKRIKDQIESNMTRESRDTFWDCFNEVAKDNCQGKVTERNAISKEIDYYLNTVRIDRSFDPYIWWSANSAQYPNLAKFARIYLSAPCSCVYSEKLLPEYGQVYQDNRNRRMPLDAEKLLFIHHNLPLVSYDY